MGPKSINIEVGVEGANARCSKVFEHFVLHQYPCALRLWIKNTSRPQRAHWHWGPGGRGRASRLSEAAKSGPMKSSYRTGGNLLISNFLVTARQISITLFIERCGRVSQLPGHTRFPIRFVHSFPSRWSEHGGRGSGFLQSRWLGG